MNKLICKIVIFGLVVVPLLITPGLLAGARPSCDIAEMEGAAVIGNCYCATGWSLTELNFVVTSGDCWGSFTCYDDICFSAVDVEKSGPNLIINCYQ